MTFLVSIFQRRRIGWTSLFLTISALASALPCRVPAQMMSHATGDTLAYSVENAVLIALERNPTVSIQRLVTESIDTYRREGRAEFDPVLSAGITNTDSKSQRFLGATREPYLLETERFQYNLGISEELPIGTTISANASMTGNKSNIYTDQFTGSVGFTINQSLLRGISPGANLARLRKANLDVDISRSELKGVAEMVTANVERAYWDLYLAKEEMAIQERSMELAEQQLRESEERVAVGKLPELELASVRAEVASRREALIQTETRYEQARLEFLFLLNPDTKDAWNSVVLTGEQPVIPIDSLDIVEDHVELGLMYR
ncbi:MAG: TolC family protein, partial [bacterium]